MSKPIIFDPDARLPLEFDFTEYKDLIDSDPVASVEITFTDLTEDGATGTILFYPTSGWENDPVTYTTTVDVYGGEDGDQFNIQCLLITDLGRRIPGNQKIRFRENAS